MKKQKKKKTGQVKGRLLTVLRAMLRLENNRKVGSCTKWDFESFNKVNWMFTSSFLARSDLERLLKSFGYTNAKPTNRDGKLSPLHFFWSRVQPLLRLRQCWPVDETGCRVAITRPRSDCQAREQPSEAGGASELVHCFHSLRQTDCVYFSSIFIYTLFIISDLSGSAHTRLTKTSLIMRAKRVWVCVILCAVGLCVCVCGGRGIMAVPKLWIGARLGPGPGWINYSN